MRLQDYRYCPECFGFYSKLTLRKHLQGCTSREYSVKEIKFLFAGLACRDDKSDEAFQCVLSTMVNDEVSTLVKGDPLILQHGRNIHEGFNFKKASEVSYRMRLLGRILKEVRVDQRNSKLSMQDMIHPSIFDSVTKCVREMCSIKPGDKENSVP